MEIPKIDDTVRSKPVLVRLTPEMYKLLENLSSNAGGGIATTIRSILERAFREGVSVSPLAPLQQPPEPRRKRAAG